MKDSGSVCALCEKEVLRCTAEDPSLATVRPTSMSCLVCTDEKGVRPESMGNPHEYFEEGTVFEDQKGQWNEPSPMLLRPTGQFSCHIAVPCVISGRERPQ